MPSARSSPRRSRHLREAEGELARLRESLATFAERRTISRVPRPSWTRRTCVRARRTSSRPRPRGSRMRTACASSRRWRVTGSPKANDAAVDALGAARHAIEQAAGLDPSLEEALQQLTEANIAAREASRTLAAYLGTSRRDPERLEHVELGASSYARLPRASIEATLAELIAWREEIASELSQGEDAEGTLSRAEERRRKAESACLAAGKALAESARRRRRVVGDAHPGAQPLGFAHAQCRSTSRTCRTAGRRRRVWTKSRWRSRPTRASRPGRWRRSRRAASCRGSRSRSSRRCKPVTALTFWCSTK